MPIRVNSTLPEYLLIQCEATSYKAEWSCEGISLSQPNPPAENSYLSTEGKGGSTMTFIHCAALFNE